MANMFEKIYIHAGLVKTGSSYLQNALDILERTGSLENTTYPELYPNSDFNSIRSGNTQYLVQNMIRPKFSKRKIRFIFNKILSKSTPNKKNLLLSGEGLFDLLPERQAYLKELLTPLCKQLKIIIFVRPYIPWIYSYYSQHVKHRGVTAPFQKWYENTPYPLISVLKNMLSYDGNITILPYTKINLLAPFLESISENPELAFNIPHQVVNRSLTANEMKLQILSSSSFSDPILTQKISESLMQTPKAQAVTPISPETVEYIKKKLPEVFTALDELDSPVMGQLKTMFNNYQYTAQTQEPPKSKKIELYDTFENILDTVKLYYSGKSV